MAVESTGLTTYAITQSADLTGSLSDSKDFIKVQSTDSAKDRTELQDSIYASNQRPLFGSISPIPKIHGP